MFRSAIELIRRQLTQGLQPASAAFAVANGLYIGIFPIIGVGTWICVAVAALFKLNQPIVLSMNVAMTIPKWLFMIPFLRLGEWVTRSEHVPLNLIELTKSFGEAPINTIVEFAEVLFHAFLGWLIVLPLALLILRGIALFFIRRGIRLREISQEKKARQSSRSPNSSDS